MVFVGFSHYSLTAACCQSPIGAASCSQTSTFIHLKRCSATFSVFNPATDEAGQERRCSFTSLPKKTQSLKGQKVSGVQNWSSFFSSGRIQRHLQSIWTTPFYFGILENYSMSGSFRLKNEGKRKYSARKGRTERSADLTGEEECSQYTINTIDWWAIQSAGFGLPSIQGFCILHLKIWVICTDWLLTFVQKKLILVWIRQLQHVSPQPRASLSFSALFSLLFFFSPVASLRLIQHFLWSRRTKTKSSLIIAQIYTQHTRRENAKTSGRHNNNNNNKTTTKKWKKRKAGFVWNIWAQQERREGVKTKPACSPRANIVYSAVHANSMNIL